MTRRLAAVALAAVLAVGLVGCAESVTTGTVIDHHYEGPYSTTSLMCMSYGKYGCTSWVPLTTHHDESWWLTLQDCSKLDPEDRPPRTTQVRYEECEHGDVEVSSTDYANTRFGTWWPPLRGEG